ncbi:MAG: 16S rRNA (guanine(966)-N(2))-methyltransferase RsmD [Acidobacteria bacterium]|nr:16S rRNA (guanine(966)-N(2))-methyltransferase RsmD [Acidobacteriota bacterium]
MRIIAGTFRSRQLQTPAGMATRPTSDRLRETLFNVIATRVPDARFVDLYAGSGAVGIEAISRGAAHVTFAEKAPKALAAIRANLKSLDVKSGFSIESGGSAVLLKKMMTSGFPADIIFLDPPYELAAEYTRTLTALGSAEFADSLHEDGLVIAEHSRKQELAGRYGHLGRTRTLLQGDAALSFYAVSEELPDVL